MAALVGGKDYSLWLMRVTILDHLHKHYIDADFRQILVVHG